MIRVLLVDDEAITLEVHELYVSRVEGFEVVGTASGAGDAISLLTANPDAYDLVLLDMTMGDGTGLDVLHAIRAAGVHVDVIAVTAVRDVEVVRQIVSLGAVNYLVKPFTFATLKDRLQSYRDYALQARAASKDASQEEIDALLGALHTHKRSAPPKGLSAETLTCVTDAVRMQGPFSAQEAATLLGLSRVVARRYLEHLATQGRVQRSPRYGTPGRPESEYRWIA